MSLSGFQISGLARSGLLQRAGWLSVRYRTFRPNFPKPMAHRPFAHRCESSPPSTWETPRSEPKVAPVFYHQLPPHVCEQSRPAKRHFARHSRLFLGPLALAHRCAKAPREFGQTAQTSRSHDLFNQRRFQQPTVQTFPTHCGTKVTIHKNY